MEEKRCLQELWQVCRYRQKSKIQMQKMRLGVDQKNLLTQAGCPEVATELGVAQFGVIGFLLGINKLNGSEVK